MKRFVYAPRVEAFVMLERDNRLIDLSEDIIRGTVQRNLNAMSTASLTLQNKFGKYTKNVQIKPMDRFVIRMSRVGKPFPILTGFIDEGPQYQLYPGPVTIKASCTLKLLQHTYFDPGLPFLVNYFAGLGWNYNPQTGVLEDGGGHTGVPGSNAGNLDINGGMGDVLWSVLQDIGGWPANLIDIRDLPLDLINGMAKLMQDAASEQDEVYQANIALLEKLFKVDLTTRSTGSSSAEPATGNASTREIAKFAADAGFKGDNLAIIVAIALRESSGKTNAMGYNSNGSYDVGLWQINTVHTPGIAMGEGNNLPAPAAADPPNHYVLNMPDDWTQVEPSLRQDYQDFINSCMNPKFNAEQAFAISSGGTSFTPWSTFNANSYAPHLEEARQAILANQQDGGSSGTDSTIVYSASGSSSGAANIAQKAGAIVDNVANGIAASVTDKAKAAAGVKRDDTKGDPVANRLISIVLAEEAKGIHETGTNTSPEISKYQQVTGAMGQAWCASFVQWALLQAGRSILDETHKTAAVIGLYDTGKALGWGFPSQPVPGDLIMWNVGGATSDDHVGFVVATNGNQITTVEGNHSDGVGGRTMTVGSEGETYMRIPGVGSGDPDTAALIDGSTSTDSTGALTPEQVALIAAKASFFQVQLTGSDTALSTMLQGKRALENDINLMTWIGELVPASGRVFTSKPKGDFAAFFPDYFGWFERTPYFRITDIEILDFTVNLNDTELTTHVFGVGPLSDMTTISDYDRASSTVASIEEPGFGFFIKLDPGHEANDPIAFLKRYGARPYVHEMQNVSHPMLLWMASWLKFMELWAKQYSTDASFTFMPEIFPGGLVTIGDRVQMFVESVTHSFDMAGGFTTSANLTAPAALNSTFFGSLPFAGFPVADNPIPGDRETNDDSNPAALTNIPNRGQIAKNIGAG